MDRRKLHYIKELLNITLGFISDYRKYCKWNYSNPHLNEQFAYEARILRQTHVIEKGLSLSNIKLGFGQEKIKELLSLLDNYEKRGFPTDGMPYKNAIATLNAYMRKQKELGFDNEELYKTICGFAISEAELNESGVKHITLKELKKLEESSFPDFFNSRHSIRQFSTQKVSYNDIYKAVELARRAPTACNRQACKVYYYEDPLINKNIGQLIPGNSGFENQIQNYLVITANISSFYDSFERNQMYIEAGIFSLAVVQSLHYFNIASCILQNGETRKREKQIRKVCSNIPENEEIMLFIAIGYYKEEFDYAVSRRREVDQILVKK